MENHSNRVFRNSHFKIWLATFVLISSLTVSSSLLAWGQHGHVVVCEIAYREMTPAARVKLVELITAHGEYASFNQSCLFADRFPRTRSAEHFLNLPRDQATVTGPGCGVANKCVESAIADDFAILADTNNDDAKRGLAMINLGHWVGDIHQPLHISFSDDRGGNHIIKKGSCSADNLHSVWDNCIIEKNVLGGMVNGWSKFTRAYRAADRLEPMITDNDRAVWTSSEPWEWAAESYEMTLNPSAEYCVQKQGSCWYEEDNETLDSEEDKRVFQNTKEYMDGHQSGVELRLIQAGVRLGHLLNLALDP